jgi:hypothetical protein
MTGFASVTERGAQGRGTRPLGGVRPPWLVFVEPRAPPPSITGNAADAVGDERAQEG